MKVCLPFSTFCLRLFPSIINNFTAYRLEWSKAYARSERWREEVMLLKEEMWCTLEFLKWRSTNWLDKASQSALKKPLPSPQVLEGLTAYAFQQADIFISLHDHFLSLWCSFASVDGSLDHPPLISTEIEDVMQGVDRGDI